MIKVHGRDKTLQNLKDDSLLRARLEMLIRREMEDLEATVDSQNVDAVITNEEAELKKMHAEMDELHKKSGGIREHFKHVG